MIKTAFPPIIDTYTEILILGSMPGEQSLAEQQYYANKQNAFWHIMFDVFNNSEPLDFYGDKLNLLRLNNIGLWDAYQACERKGSLDTNIRNGVVNDFETLFKTHPKIRLVLFNGVTSYASLKKHKHLFSNLEINILPSTSPAHTILYTAKLSAWHKALKQS